MILAVLGGRGPGMSVATSAGMAVAMPAGVVVLPTLDDVSTAAPPSMRDRVVDSAVRLTTEVGWAKVTMARLADDVGVSRQTVYNEVGTKAGLAEAMILRELERFLATVTVAFDAHPDDLVEAIRASARSVLEVAPSNPLLHAVVSATHGADTELLPLLTTHAGSLLAAAKDVIAARIAPYDVDLRAAELDAHHVGVRVHPEVGGLKDLLGPLGSRSGPSGDDDGRGSLLHDFLRETRARKDAEALHDR